MLRMYSVRSGRVGSAGELLASCSQLPTLTVLSNWRNVTPRKFDSVPFAAIILPRQLGLCPRASVGTCRRVRRGLSLGGMTPAGAIKPGHTARFSMHTELYGMVEIGGLPLPFSAPEKPALLKGKIKGS